ncbi:MAG: hypothetical protein ABSE51_16925 [Terracidiphilus sp.]|jgi:hypothetical protein
MKRRLWLTMFICAIICVLGIHAEDPLKVLTLPQPERHVSVIRDFQTERGVFPPEARVS